MKRTSVKKWYSVPFPEYLLKLYISADLKYGSSKYFSVAAQIVLEEALKKDEAECLGLFLKQLQRGNSLLILGSTQVTMQET